MKVTSLKGRTQLFVEWWGVSCRDWPMPLRPGVICYFRKPKNQYNRFF
jgi:hypothetical protein